MRINYDFTMAVETVLLLKKRNRNDYINAEEIAEELGFSIGYLQKVIQALGKHGIIECKRGRIGGTRLRKRKVTLLDLWNVMLGEIDVANLPVPALKKPMKAFEDAMSKVVVCEKK